MINVLIEKKLFVESIMIKGHAGYKDYGKDIVCSAVSTAIIMTINLIEKFNQQAEIKIEEGYFYLKVINESKVLEILLENLVYTVKDLEEQFPKYINIK